MSSATPAHSQAAASAAGQLAHRFARPALYEKGILTAMRMARHLPGSERIPVGGILDQLFRPSLERLHALEARMAPQLERTESEFLTFGASLSLLSRACDEIVGKGERLFALATGTEKGEESVTGTLEILRKPIAYVTTFAGDEAGMARQTANAEQAASRILDSDARLRRAVQPLVYLRTLFQIESATLPEEVQQMFAALNAEIHALENRVTHEFSGKFAELRNMRQTLEHFSQQHEQQRRSLAERSGAQSSALDASFSSLRQSLCENASRQSGLAKVTRELAADVNAMVVAMQAHDMVSQRVAHVRYGLEKLYQEFAALASARLAEARLRLPGFAAVARLQASQVRSASRQLEEASRSLLQSVEKVVEHVHSMDEDGLTMRDYTHITSAGTGTIQILLNAIDETRDLVAAAFCAAEACYAPLQPLDAAAKTLTGNIDSTGAQMHRIALNTLLIAVRHGLGTGLEVLAENTATTAGEISAICQETETQARDLSQGLSETLRVFSEVVEHGRNIAAEIDQQGSARQAELHALRDCTLQALLDMGSAVEQARSVVSSMQSIDLTPLCREILPESEAVIDELARLATSFCNTIDAQMEGGGLLDELAAQYSMDSERQTHAQLFDSGAVANAGSASGGALGSNVDLF